MTLITIVQDAASRMGFVQPTAGIGSTDSTALQLVGLAKQEVAELARAYPWQNLTLEKTFTSVATEEQTGAIPDGFDRFLPSTFFNRDTQRIVVGPLTPTEWQDLKGRASVAVYDAFRQRGNALLLMPVPTAGQTYAFEYITKYAVTDSSGATPQATFTSDDDLTLLDEELVTLGLVWRFLRAKGLDYAEAFRSYEMQKKQAMARDGGQRGANMSKATHMRNPRYPAFPDASWDVT